MARFAPAFFVVLWSTGFLVARYATEDAGPFTFLAIRTAVAGALLWGVARAVGEARVARGDLATQSLVGVGMHAMYLGGVFAAINFGLPAGLSALIAGLHPVGTAVLSRWVLAEHLSVRQWVGTVLGMIGVAAVVIDRGVAGAGVSGRALAAMAVAVAGMVGGTIIQRRRAGDVPLLGGTAVQYAATTAILAVPAVAVERWEFTLTQRSLLSFAWAIGVLSVAAVLTMLWLLKRREATSVSSLFFLTPALSALGAAVLFGERLGWSSAAGLVVALVGVRLVTAPAVSMREPVTPRQT
ncbi:MAG: DMT family transporter [Ilumatobacteraceae bacterium]